MSIDLQRAPIQFPPDVDGSAVVRDLGHSGYWLTSEAGIGRRRAVTRRSPLRFMLTYLGHRLRQQDTGLMSLCPFHLDAAQAALRWMEPHPVRDAWVGPRGLGKSDWFMLGLPLWALAHGWRRFFLPVSYTAEQAQVHLANLRMEIDDNELLRHDFPELAPKRARGATNSARMVVANGATIAAIGLKGTALGIKSGTARPDLIVGDDPEPSEADYSPAAKVKLLSKLTQGVLPMGARHTVVQLTGTVTMRGSMMHNVVDAAKGRPGGEWVRARGFEPRYYPPILPDGSSLWPQRWSVEYLRAEQARDAENQSDDYALNFENDPQGTAGVTYWTPGSFRYNDRFPTVERVLHVDVATTRRAGSDYTVLALVGVDASGLRACVERVEWGKWSAPQIRTRIHAFCDGLRRLPRVRVEGNQGGDTWLDSLAPWPMGVAYEVTHASVNKRVRIATAHAHYARRAVEHAWEMPELEAELCLWPRGPHDDVPDAVAGALEAAFS